MSERPNVSTPSLNTPAITNEFNRSFKLVRSLPCDVQLGDHPAQYNMQAKYAKLQSGSSNPFIDPDGYKSYVTEREQAFLKELERQTTAARQ